MLCFESLRYAIKHNAGLKVKLDVKSTVVRRLNVVVRDPIADAIYVHLRGAVLAEIFFSGNVRFTQVGSDDLL